MTDWYLWDGGEPQGPMDEGALEGRLRSHADPAAVRVWTKGFAEWKTVEDALGPGFAKAPAPPPLPQDTPPAFESPPEAIAAPEPPRAQNFIARHWRGEYPLWVSYWVVGFASNIAATLAIVLASQLMVTQVSFVPLGLWTFFVTMWSMLLALAIWQATGIWRSATRRRLERRAAGRRAFWPVVAKIAVCLGGVQLGAVLIKAGVPQITEATRMAFLGDPSIPSYKVRLINGTDAEIAGGIKYGVTRDFEKLLDEQPGIRIVHLDSLGGRIGEGKKLNALIRARKLDTYVETKCMSACTLAFAGGAQRLLLKGAVLGFHRGAFPGSNPGDTDSGVERQIYGAAGFSKAFVDRALATKNADMWKPDTTELLTYRVITKVTDGRELAWGGTPVTRDQWDQIMLKSAAVYSALRQRNPAEYGQMLDMLAAGSASGTTQAELTDRTQARLRGMIMTLLPQADDDVLVEFGKLRADEYRALQGQDAASCYRFVSGNALNVSDTKRLPPELAKRQLALHEQIVLSARTRDKAAGAEASIKASWDVMRANLVGKGYTSADLQLLAQPDPASPARYCATAVELFAEITRLPGKDAALVLRDMYGASK